MSSTELALDAEIDNSSQTIDNSTAKK